LQVMAMDEYWKQVQELFCAVYGNLSIRKSLRIPVERSSSYKKFHSNGIVFCSTLDVIPTFD